MSAERRGLLRRTLRILGAVGLGFFLLAMFYGCVEEGATRRDMVNGEGEQGTFTLEYRKRHAQFRAPATWSWAGTFTGEDGTVICCPEIEPLSGEGTSKISGGGWKAGDEVEAQWSSRTPDEVYLASTNTYRYWVESMVFVGAFLAVSLVVWGLVVLSRRRPKQRATPERVVARPPSVPKLSEREVQQSRIKALEADLAKLRASLDETRRPERS